MNDLLNQLEPSGLIDAFMAEPPEGFIPIAVECGGTKALPGFLTRLDLATAAERNVRKWLERLSFIVPRPKTLFIGTTVSEYAPLPRGVKEGALGAAAVARLRELRASFLIIKDIPSDSPLLTEAENAYSRSLVSSLEGRGFFILKGQALAYVPVDFSSTEEFLQRFSKSRRKDFKRKLRSFSEVAVEEIPAGDPFFSDAVVDRLYGLFINVYNQSEVHFDKLTRPFFKRVFKDPRNGGVVFLYRRAGDIIGFNLCFRQGGRLVDKYVGFLYPQAQEVNLYFLSWFYNLDYCVKNGLETFVAGWTDPEIKAYLGARFTYTRHAVYIRNPLLRLVLGRFKRFFESDGKALEKPGE